ncbi:hypothetical protein [Mucilaginibacter sp.]|uniref:hypothetical protein n=1 Tax=Mucilaginibacter sp. TaxID=1882438 RepID=UPI0035BBBF42
MKYLYICLALIACLAVTSCSKKGDAQPTVHTVRFQATGTASMTAVVSVVRASTTTSTTLDTKTVATGTTYDFSTPLNNGDAIHFELQTMSENAVSYTVSDNGTIVSQVTGKELGSFSKTTADFVLN